MLTKSSPPLSAATIEKALREFGLSLSAHKIAQVQAYISMLLAWNARVNLTAIREPVEILYRHFCESMFATTIAPLNSSRLADVGSGGGFPGLPLKIICPDLQLFLVESNVKKATFLAEAVRELEMKDARVLVSRYEELAEELAPLDVVCSRALGDFGRFLTWAGSPQIGAKKVLLWVGADDAAIVRQMGGWKWQEAVAIPQSLRRYILLGEKTEGEGGW
jgi:16S rRNA (guanine527-N7)-methyltransferase